MRKRKKKDQDKKGILVFAGLLGVGLVTFFALKDRNNTPTESVTDWANNPNPSAPGRGLTNNNPLNIKLTNIPWQGKRPNNLNTDGVFEQFDTLAHGYRAAIKNLRSYITQGITGMDQVIQTWAPDSTGNYQAYVKQRMGLDPNQNYNLGGGWLNNQQNTWSLVKAMAEFENNPNASANYISNNQQAFNDAWLML